MTIGTTPTWEPKPRSTLVITLMTIVALLAVLTWIPGKIERAAAGLRAAGEPRPPRPLPPRIDRFAPSPRDLQRATTAPAESRVAYQPTSRRVRHVSVGAQHRVRVTDTITGDVLAGASITTQAGLRVGPASADGMLDLPAGSTFRLPAKLTVTIPTGDITVPIEGIYDDDADAHVAVVTASIKFRLVVELHDLTHADNDVNIRLTDFPALPDDAAIAPMDPSVLRLNRAIPETYLGMLDARHLRPHPFIRQVSVHLVDGRGRVAVVDSYQGPTVMTVTAPGCMGVTHAVAFDRGNERRIYLVLRPEPVVSGVVVDQHGAPVAAAAVHVLCLAALRSGDFANVANGRGAIGLVGDEFTKIVTQEWTQAVTSGDDGRFEIIAPFTEDVVAYVVDAHTRFFKLERRGTRSASQIRMQVVAAPPNGDFRVRVVDDATGQPLVGCTGTLLQAPDDNPWGITLPALPIDEDGYLHMDGLRVAATFALTVARGGQTLGDASVFVASRDATVRVKLRK